MVDFLKKLFEGGLPEEARKEIEEAWNAKVEEIRELTAAELREEFANRYERDKAQLAEAVEKMANESLEKVMQGLHEEKVSLVADRVKVKKSLEAFESFASKQIRDELKEFSQDRDVMRKQLVEMEKFFLDHMNKELKEFHEDKKSLVDQRAKLIAEGKKKLEETRASFVRRAARLAESFIKTNMQREFYELRHELKEAKQKRFGMKIFEAFANEFSLSHFNSNKEIKKLVNALKHRDKLIEGMQAEQSKKLELLESATKRARRAEDLLERSKTLNTLLAPLDKRSKQVMQELLENVNTSQLESKFEQYLPSVMKTDSKTKSKVLNEGKVIKEVTGDRQANDITKSLEEENRGNVEDISRILYVAGIKK